MLCQSRETLTVFIRKHAGKSRIIPAQFAIGLFVTNLRTQTMAIHAEAVDVLVRKGRFEPDVALGVAEAIEVSITLAQLVTVPVLDSRVQDLKNEIQAVRADFKIDLAKEVGRLDKTIATEVGRLDKTIATEIGRLDATLATEVGRLDKTIAAEIGRLDATLATEIGRLDKTIATEIGRLDTTLATEIAKSQEKFTSEIGKTNAEVANVRVEVTNAIADLGSDLRTEIQKIAVEMQKIRADLIRWVFLTMLGSITFSLGASTIQKMLLN